MRPPFLTLLSKYMSVSARLKLSAVTGTALLACTCGTGCAWANVAKPTVASSTRPIFRNGTRIGRLSILRTSGPPHSYIIPGFIVPMIHSRLQSLLTIALETITGVAQAWHRDNVSYRFGLLFVWPLGRRKVKKLKRQRTRSLIHGPCRPSGTFLGRSMAPPFRDNSRDKGTVMDWARILAYVTGTVDQELLARNEYLATENRILKAQLSGRLKLSDAERGVLGEIGHRVGRKVLADVATIARPDTILG